MQCASLLERQLSIVENRLLALGLSLPPPLQAPPGVALPFQFIHIVGRRALISGHGPQTPDGSFAQPLAHCRSAVGLAELPFNIPVEIEGEVELSASADCPAGGDSGNK